MVDIVVGLAGFIVGAVIAFDVRGSARWVKRRGVFDSIQKDPASLRTIRISAFSVGAGFLVLSILNVVL